MKPPTVFLGEMTNPEVEAFLAAHHTVMQAGVDAAIAVLENIERTFEAMPPRG